MALFYYQALERNGRKTKGMIEADSARHARQLLRGKELIPVHIEARLNASTGGMLQRRRHAHRRVAAADLALFTRQLATLVQAAMPLETCLQAVSEQSEKLHVKSLGMALRSRIQEGDTLSDSLREQPRVVQQHAVLRQLLQPRALRLTPPRRRHLLQLRLALAVVLRRHVPPHLRRPTPQPPRRAALAQLAHVRVAGAQQEQLLQRGHALAQQLVRLVQLPQLDVAAHQQRYASRRAPAPTDRAVVLRVERVDVVAVVDALLVPADHARPIPSLLLVE